eukprot:gene21425-22290_t
MCCHALLQRETNRFRRWFGQRVSATTSELRMNRYSYQIYEMAHLALAPARVISDATRLMYQNPINPFAHTSFGRNVAASAELFERVTRRYGKPSLRTQYG